MSEALENYEGTVSNGSYKLNNLRFADAMDLFGESKENFRTSHDDCAEQQMPTVLGYDVKLHPAVQHLLSSLCRSLRRSLSPSRYW